MEIKINVDELKFKEVLEKELGAFSKEEIRDIIKEGIKDLIKKDKDKSSYDENILLQYFLEKNNSYYGGHLKPTRVLEGIIQSTVNDKEGWKDLVEDIQKEMIKILKENYKSIIESTFKQMFINGITASIVSNSEFQTNMNSVIHSIMEDNMVRHMSNCHSN